MLIKFISNVGPFRQDQVIDSDLVPADMLEGYIVAEHVLLLDDADVAVPEPSTRKKKQNPVAESIAEYVPKPETEQNGTEDAAS